MRLEFVNHASLVVDTGGVRLISDPWLEGMVFNNGWVHLSRTAFSWEDFRDITHIWFSHEHPDHFFPPNVKKIPPDCRRNITVLYRATRDRRVVDFCSGLGFKEIRELPMAEWVELAPGVAIQCDTYGEDSWLCIKTPEGTLLNLNDCEMASTEDMQEIAAKVGTVDVLATQFSYASWAGSEPAARSSAARAILKRVQTQAEVVRPRYLIPFASFVWFCHEENYYMNQQANRIEDAARFISGNTGAEPVVLYPGDSWQVGEPHSHQAALERYEQDYEAVAERRPEDLSKSDPVSSESLAEAAESFWQRLGEVADSVPLRLYLALLSHKLRQRRGRRGDGSSRLGRALAALLLRLEPAHLHLSDQSVSYRMDLRQGLRPSDRAADDCDIILSSDSLAYCFRRDWGSETLEVNGRFRVPSIDVDRYTFHNYFSPLRRQSFGYAPLKWGPLLRAAARKILR